LIAEDIMQLSKTIHPQAIAIQTTSNERHPSAPILPSRFGSVSGIESIPLQQITPVVIAGGSQPLNVPRVA
jgi:hypothetical protein